MLNRLDHTAGFLTALAPKASTPRGKVAACSETTHATPEEIFALVYSQIRALAGKRDVDELAQVAAEQAIRGLSKFEGRSQLSTWTFRICYLTIRKHDRWYRRWLHRFTLTRDGELPDPPDESGTAERVASLAERERLARLQSALQQLSSKQRAVVVLHDIEGLSVEEIGSVVGALPVAVRSRLRDGRRALAQRLMNDPYFGDEVCRRKVKK